jgi:hypothetical protein
VKKCLILLLLVITTNIFAIEVESKNYFTPSFYDEVKFTQTDSHYLSFWNDFDEDMLFLYNKTLVEITPTSNNLEWASSVLFNFETRNGGRDYYEFRNIIFPTYIIARYRIDVSNEIIYGVFNIKQKEFADVRFFKEKR